MSEIHRIKKRLTGHLRRYTNNSVIIRGVFDTLGNEANWQRMVDYIEYAHMISEKLDIKRIMAKAVIFGLRKAPSALRTVRRELRI